jgi:hypothetical protein
MLHPLSKSAKFKSGLSLVALLALIAVGSSPSASAGQTVGREHQRSRTHFSAG